MRLGKRTGRFVAATLPLISVVVCFMAPALLKSQMSNGTATPASGYLLTAESFPGAEAGDRIAACIAALPADGGICDARSLGGKQKISRNPFQDVAKPVVLLLGMANIELAATLDMGSGQIIIGSPGIGGRGFTPTGTVITPVKGFPSRSVIRIDPANRSSKSYSTTGSFVRDIIIDMANIPAGKVAVELNSVVYEAFEGIQVLHNDGISFLLGKSANPGSQKFCELLMFRDIFIEGDGIDRISGPVIEIDAAQSTVWSSSRLIARSAGHPTPDSIGVLIQGNSAYNDFHDLTIAGPYTHVKLRSNSEGSPSSCRFSNIHHENYNVGYDIGGTPAFGSIYEVVDYPSFVSPVSSSAVDVLLNDYARFCRLNLTGDYGAPHVLVRLAKHAEGNIVFMNSAEAGVADEGINNLILGRSRGSSLLTKPAPMQ